MERATLKQIEGRIDLINKLTDKPGKVGYYELTMAYGGHGLDIVYPNSGAKRIIGHTTKRDLLNRLDAMISVLMEMMR